MPLEELAMALNKVRLGDYIERSTTNNHDLKYGCNLIQGVTSKGVFAVPKIDANTVDLKPYKIVNNGAFVYNPSRLNIGSIAYRTEGLCIVSHLYIVFYLNEKGKKEIDPIYLYMYMRRDEFFREVTFRNFGSQRPEFNFNKLSDIELYLPPIEIQRKYVAVYEAMVENQKSYEQGLEDLRLTCEAEINEIKHNSPKVPTGHLLREIDNRNTDEKIKNIHGINITKSFMPSVASVSEGSIKNYKLVSNGQFVYSSMQTGKRCFCKG